MVHIRCMKGEMNTYGCDALKIRKKTLGKIYIRRKDVCTQKKVIFSGTVEMVVSNIFGWLLYTYLVLFFAFEVDDDDDAPSCATTCHHPLLPPPPPPSRDTDSEKKGDRSKPALVCLCEKCGEKTWFPYYTLLCTWHNKKYISLVHIHLPCFFLQYLEI